MQVHRVRSSECGPEWLSFADSVVDESGEQEKGAEDCGRGQRRKHDGRRAATDQRGGSRRWRRSCVAAVHTARQERTGCCPFMTHVLSCSLAVALCPSAPRQRGYPVPGPPTCRREARAGGEETGSERRLVSAPGVAARGRSLGRAGGGGVAGGVQLSGQELEGVTRRWRRRQAACTDARSRLAYTSARPPAG